MSENKTESSTTSTTPALTLGTLGNKLGGGGGIGGLGKKEGIEPYAPKGSATDAFLKAVSATAQDTVAALTTTRRNRNYTPRKTNASYIADIEVSGVNYNEMFIYTNEENTA